MSADKPAAAPTAGAYPYPGLRPFREDEQHLFFGRERQVDAMVQKMRATRFLAVVGSSGSGKSSLVNCGLRPALYRGMLDSAGSRWRTAVCRPGNRPLRALANALCAPGALYDTLKKEDFEPAALVESTLRSSRLGLVDAFDEAHLPAGTHLLLVVDQFEELFRYGSLAGGGTAHGPSADAVALVNLLLAVREQTEGMVHVVITMRSDFLGDCAQFQGLPEALNSGQYLVPRMTREERRMAITGPAATEGARISPVLLTRLVNDVGDNPDQLSILQHALNRTWAKWVAKGSPGGELQLEHYEEAGTMDRALDDHAERAFGELDPAQQQIAQHMFRALTDSSTDPRGIRRPTTFEALCEIVQASPEALLEVMAVFRKPSRSFLMPPLAEPVDAASVVDISHESLMRLWKRLRAWGADEAQSAQMLRRLGDAARGYPNSESLWQDPKLQLALNWQRQQQPNAAWAAQYGVADLPAAMNFLQASETARAEQAAEAKASTEAAARRHRHLRLAIGGTVVGGLVALLAFTTWKGRQDAEHARALERSAQDQNVAVALVEMLQQGQSSAAGRGDVVEVPKVEGAPLAEALLLLENKELGVEVREVEHAQNKPGHVMRQFPIPPTPVAKGEPVYLVVAVTAAQARENAERKKVQVAAAAASAAEVAKARQTDPAGDKQRQEAEAAARAEAAAAAAQAQADADAKRVAAERLAAADRLAVAERMKSVTVPADIVSTAPPAPAVAPTPVTPTAPPPPPQALPRSAPPPGPLAGDCKGGDWTPWMSNAQFQAEASKRRSDVQDFYPVAIEGRLEGGELRFRGLFKPRIKGVNFNWDIYRSDKDRLTLREVRNKQGLAVSCESFFLDTAGNQRWQITWVSKPR